MTAPMQPDPLDAPDVFLCGPESVGFGECWFCADTVPDHVADKRFCSHDCAADWDREAAEHKATRGELR